MRLLNRLVWRRALLVAAMIVVGVFLGAYGAGDKPAELVGWWKYVDGATCRSGCPDDKDWDNLVTTVGGGTVAGKALKSTSSWIGYEDWGCEVIDRLASQFPRS